VTLGSSLRLPVLPHPKLLTLKKSFTRSDYFLQQRQMKKHSHASVGHFVLPCPLLGPICSLPMDVQVFGKMSIPWLSAQGAPRELLKVLYQVTEKAKRALLYRLE